MKPTLTIAIIGGNWDQNTGRPSSYVEKFATELTKVGNKITAFNGGSYETLKQKINDGELKDFSVIIWMPNVPNELPKVRDVKEVYPHSLLVTSKRNNSQYSFQELVSRSLSQKANLTIDFNNKSGIIVGRLFDPLGVLWQDYTDNITLLAHAVSTRLGELTRFTRQKTVQIDVHPILVPEETEFFHLIRDFAEIFHTLIAPAEGTTRFLGNSSFRCMKGFPGFRNDGTIFISRRNVDKRYIDASSFVAIRLNSGHLEYWGHQKPSVDAPIQIRLFEKLPNIKYMIHGHVYAKDVVWSKKPISCGAIEEAEEILSHISNVNTDFFALNLLGHGFIAMADTVEKLKNLSFVPRKLPEKIN